MEKKMEFVWRTQIAPVVQVDVCVSVCVPVNWFHSTKVVYTFAVVVAVLRVSVY